MTADTLGKIYVLIQRDYTKAALASRDEAPEKRKQCAEHLRKCAEIFKHDICMFVDAELEKARALLESEDTLRGHVIYPPSPEWLDGIGLDDRIWAREADESRSALEFSNAERAAVKKFFAALRARCESVSEEDNCLCCDMRLFCYTAPCSNTDDMLDTVMNFLQNRDLAAEVAKAAGYF